MPIGQLQKIKALRERGIRNRNQALEQQKAISRERCLEVCASLTQNRTEWRLAVQEKKPLNARAFNRHIETMSAYSTKDARIVEQLTQLQQEMQQLEQAQEEGRIALRDNLRGQEKFSFLAEEMASQQKL